MREHLSKLSSEAMRLVRANPEITSLGTLSKLAGHQPPTLKAAFEETKSLDALLHVFERRKGQELASKIWRLIEHYRSLSETCGYAATERDLKIAGGPTHKVYTYHFGNLGTLQWLLGYKPTEQGVHGHLANRSINPRPIQVVEQKPPLERRGRIRQNAEGFKGHRISAA